MKKLCLDDYEVEIVTPTGKEKTTYEVKTAILNMMFQAELKLNAAMLLEQNKVAEKILDCKDHDILLEDAEFARIKQAVDITKGFTRNDVKLVIRINEANAVNIEVEEPDDVDN